jgi:hypothetical protein
MPQEGPVLLAEVPLQLQSMLEHLLILFLLYQSQQYILLSSPTLAM